MALEAQAGTFNVTATGSKQISTLDFTPKALFLFCTSNASADGALANAEMSFGFAANTTNEHAVAFASENGQNPSDADRRNDFFNVILTQLDNTQTVETDCTLTSFNSDGFTLNFGTLAATREVGFLALGGSDITDVGSVQFTTDTVAQEKSVTGMGFQPDMVIGMFCGISSEPATNSFAIISIGGAISAWIEMDFVAMESDGFRFDQVVANASARFCAAIGIKGGQFEIGSDTAVVTTPATKKTAMSIAPKGVLFLGSERTTLGDGDANTNGSLGFSSGASESTSAWIGAEDGVTTTNNSQYLDGDKCIKARQPSGATPTLDSEAGMFALNSNGMTLDWTTVDGTARQFIYLAMGEAIVEVGPTIIPLEY
jgi:hypothetical protein